MDTLRTAYRALLDERCPNCRHNLDQSHARLSQEDSDTYSTAYTCPHCDTTTQYTVTIEPPAALVNVQSANGDPISDTQKMLAQLAKRGESGEQQFNYVHYLNTSLNIVNQNLNRVFAWGERFPEIFEQNSENTLTELDNQFANDLVVNLGRDNRWIALHTDIHNYLSSVYSHHQFVEDTIASIMASDADVDRLQTQYNADSKALLGLRHYTQHQMMAPLHVQLNTGSADRAVDILVKLDDLRDYDYRDGFDYWFESVDGSYIDIIGHGIQHYKNAGNRAINQIETALEEHRQSFQEMEALQEEYPRLDDIDAVTNTDVE